MADLENKEFQEEIVESEKELTFEEQEHAEREKMARWYVLQTIPSKDEFACENLKKKIKNPIIGNSIFDVKVLYHDKAVEKDGKITYVKAKTYPSYIYIKMIYSKAIWWEIINTDGVKCFLGPNGRPQPLKPEEVRRNKLEAFDDVIFEFNIGDMVKSTDQAFAGVPGKIIEINEEGKKAHVLISMFGRDIPCWFDFENLEKV